MTASANSVHNNAVHILPYFKRNSLYEVVRTQIVSLQLVCVYFFPAGREVQRGTLWHTTYAACVISIVCYTLPLEFFPSL